MHSDALLCFTGALLIKTVIKNNGQTTFASAGFDCRMHVNQLCIRQPNPAETKVDHLFPAFVIDDYFYDQKSTCGG